MAGVTPLFTADPGAAGSKAEWKFFYDLSAASLPAFVCQYRFDVADYRDYPSLSPSRPWRVSAKPMQWRSDFAWPDAGLLVEFEGGVWAEERDGAHNRGAGYVKDCQKYNAAQVLGYQVLRFATNQTRPEGYGWSEAIQIIRAWFALRNL